MISSSFGLQQLKGTPHASLEKKSTRYQNRLSAIKKTYEKSTTQKLTGFPKGRYVIGIIIPIGHLLPHYTGFQNGISNSKYVNYMAPFRLSKKHSGLQDLGTKTPPPQKRVGGGVVNRFVLR